MTPSVPTVGRGPAFGVPMRSTACDLQVAFRGPGVHASGLEDDLSLDAAHALDNQHRRETALLAAAAELGFRTLSITPQCASGHDHHAAETAIASNASELFRASFARGPWAGEVAGCSAVALASPCRSGRA